LRDHWLGLDHRNGQTPVIGAEIASADETYEALVDGRRVCLLASGNVSLVERGGVVTRPVNGVSPSQLALAWRKDRNHPLVRAYVECARQAVA
jgi:DNA-binding transcriptional LysR family regulator